MQDDDRFGVRMEDLAAAQRAHGSSPAIRVGVYVPTRGEVRSMPPEQLRPLLVDWMWESPTELIPTDEQMRQVQRELESRSDVSQLLDVIEECRRYIGA